MINDLLRTFYFKMEQRESIQILNSLGFLFKIHQMYIKSTVTTLLSVRTKSCKRTKKKVLKYASC